MGTRLELHEELCAILGSSNVYFQPPGSVMMQYPCIRYSIARVDKRNANDKAYMHTVGYDVTVIDADPDSEIPMKILTHFPMCSLDREYASNNLNHNVLTLYY